MEEKMSQITTEEHSTAGLTDSIVALLPLFVPAYFFYGERPLYIGFFTVLACLSADILCTLLRGKKLGRHNLSAVVTGLIIALLMPASAAYTVPVLAGLFAILVVKHPFGGYGRNLFNPAAAGYAFATVLFPKVIFAYPAPFIKLPAFGEFLTTGLESDVLASLKLETVPKTELFNMLLGYVAGPLGTTSILVIAACLLYMLLRKAVKFKMVFPFLAVVFLFAYLLPRITANPLTAAAYELMSGSLFFGCVFIISDPGSSPKTGRGIAAYGILCGLLTMVFRYFGAFEEGLCFAVIIMNSLSGLLDRELAKISFKKIHINIIGKINLTKKEVALGKKGGTGFGHKNNKNA